MTKVKICGLKRKEDIEFANILLPEYAGFVFAASPRQVSAEQAAKLRAELDLRVRTVGVFVKEDINFIKRLAAERIIDVVQLHGDESQEYCRELRRKINLPVIKVLRVRNIESLRVRLIMNVIICCLILIQRLPMAAAVSALTWRF